MRGAAGPAREGSTKESASRSRMEPSSMSHALIARNADLARLQESGLSLRVVDGYLVIDGVPYVSDDGHVKEACLVLTLDLSGDDTVRPNDHTAFWTGGLPHKSSGQPMVALGEATHAQTLSDGTVITRMFSAKPTGGRYRDYYHKVGTYIELLGREARRVDAGASAYKWLVQPAGSEGSVFCFMETASARQGTTELARRLQDEKVAIIGVGGTGSYVLDYVAKTWVREIHLYDRDRFLQHNAFRAPGAVSAEEMQGGPSKAVFHAVRYGGMRQGVTAHAERIDSDNVQNLASYDTVFVCIDGGPIKREILDVCEQHEILCIDSGMGLYRVGDRLGGILRTTTSAPGHRDHVEGQGRIDMDGGGPGEYERNMQMAELNALNAALAVIKWKKVRGVYQDLGREGDCGYVLDGNRIINRDMWVETEA